MIGNRQIGSAPISSLIITYRSISETPSVSETIGNYKIASRSLSDTLTLTEVIGSSIKYAELIESLTVTEDLDVLKILLRSLSDTVVLSEVLNTSGIITRSVTEDVTLIETVVRPNAQANSDTLTITESVSYVIPFKPVIIDTVSLVEEVSVSKIVSKSLSETITLTETGVRVQYFDIIENVNLIETLKLVCIFTLHIAEAVPITEGYRIESYLKKMQEGISPVETVTYHLVPKCNITETITLGETVSPHLVPYTSAEETLEDLSEDLSFVLIPALVPSDDVELFEFVDLTFILNLSVCDCIILSEAVRKVTEISVAEAITLSEISNQTSVIEALTLTEAIVTNIVYASCCTDGYIPNKAITELLEVEELIGLKRTIRLAISESLEVNNTVVYIPGE